MLSTTCSGQLDDGLGIQDVGVVVGVVVGMVVSVVGGMGCLEAEAVH